MSTAPLLQDLEARGLVADCTDLLSLDTRLQEGPAKMYVGFDPTAASLHIGSLMPLLVGRLVQRHGHIPVFLIGGATGMIGDPSGRSDERNLLSTDTLDHNRDALTRQIRSLGSATGDAIVVDNRDWLAPMSALELLGEVGVHFPVNTMLARDSVRLRRESEGGLTFTEFAYQLLQAFDFWWLRAHEGVEVQLGGSDQWGNITAGIDFMRRRDGSRAWGLVWPLLTKADGSKFGKTAGGNVWLDAALTSPFDFWQFWFNTEDADVEQMLLRFSEREVHELSEAVTRHRANPGRREAQRILANDVTSWVHGLETAAAAERAAAVLFGGDDSLDARALELLESHLDVLRLSRSELEGCSFNEIALRGGLANSLGDARRLAAGGGLHIGDLQLSPVGLFSLDLLVDGGWALMRKGRRNWLLIRATD